MSEEELKDTAEGVQLELVDQAAAAEDLTVVRQLLDARTSQLEVALMHQRELLRSLATVRAALTHGEPLRARDLLNQAIARMGEYAAPAPLAGELGGNIPCTGRGLKRPDVTARPREDGLVLRVDDDANPAFWLEMVLSETKLLRLLAQVHRLSHGG